ncbi:hypothetical protein [Candidatus Ichthyocystis sparus]|uniref:hypothetical protein n=1 Tax=Candidatus Ichthyocystis sparus TaxID=1561004 RepID=UPI000B88B13D|nr:hypothetical protein [Candidatus Ichthyocystis sparus]
MFYNDLKFLGCSQSDKFEFKTDNEILEDVECETVVVSKYKNNFQLTDSSFVNGSLASRCAATSLIVLNALGSASGSNKASSRPLSYHLCALEGSLCELISLKKFGYSVFVDNAFKKSFEDAEHSLEEKFDFNFSIPFSLPSSEGINEIRIADQLLAIEEHIKEEYEYVLFYHLADQNRVNNHFCRQASIKFCDKNHNVNTTVSQNCCNNISAYITHYPITSTTAASEILSSTMTTTAASEILSSTMTTTAASEILSSTMTTTAASEILSSTTMISGTLNLTTLRSEIVNLTSSESTILIPTLITPVSNDTTVLTVVLVAILSLTVAIFSFLGYRTYVANKSRHPQHELGQLRVDEDVENLL